MAHTFKMKKTSVHIIMKSHEKTNSFNTAKLTMSKILIIFLHKNSV